MNDPAVQRLVTSGIRALVVAVSAKFGYDLAAEQVNDIVGWAVVGVGIAASLFWSFKEQKKQEASK